MAWSNFWDDPKNATKYDHIVPEMLHQDSNGRYIAWDAGNKAFRYANKEGTEWIGDPKDIPKRSKVDDAEFIKAYIDERSTNGSLEGLIKRLGYYKNNLQGLRARISDVNGFIKLALKKHMGADKAEAFIAKQKEDPTKMLYGLQSAHTLRGGSRGNGPDLDSIWAAISDV